MGKKRRASDAAAVSNSPERINESVEIRPKKKLKTRHGENDASLQEAARSQARHEDVPRANVEDKSGGKRKASLSNASPYSVHVLGLSPNWQSSVGCCTSCFGTTLSFSELQQPVPRLIPSLIRSE